MFGMAELGAGAALAQEPLARRVVGADVRPRTILSATSSPSSRRRARNTAPMPPSASGSTIS